MSLMSSSSYRHRPPSLSCWPDASDPGHACAASGHRRSEAGRQSPSSQRLPDKDTVLVVDRLLPLPSERRRRLCFHCMCVCVRGCVQQHVLMITMTSLGYPVSVTSPAATITVRVVSVIVIANINKNFS